MKGLYIGRFQPLHKGHLSVVRQMDKSDIDEIYIGIGSAQYENTDRNPFSFEERKEMVERSLEIEKPYKIYAVDDIHDPPNWVNHIESITGLNSEYDVIFTLNSGDIKLYREAGYEVREPEIEYDICATVVRKLMREDGEWEKHVPDAAKEFLKEIGIERIKNC